MRELSQKWGVVAKAALVVLPLLGIKALFHRFGVEAIAVGPVITALIAGVFFVIAIMLSGVMPDFKESERIPSELAAAVEALLVLLLAKMDSYHEGLLLVGVVSAILVSVVFLIRDMDNPFDGSATVDLRVLKKLEDDLLRR